MWVCFFLRFFAMPTSCVRWRGRCAIMSKLSPVGSCGSAPSVTRAMWNDDEDPWAGSEAMASMEAEWLAEAHDGPPPEDDTVEAPEEEAAKEVPEASSSPSTPSQAGDSSLMEDVLGRPAMSHSPARPVRDATRKRASPRRTLPLASDNKETPPAKRLRGKQPPRETPEKTLPCNERTWAASDGTAFDALGGRARYMKFWNKWLFWKRQRRRVAMAQGEVAVQDALEAFEGKSLKVGSKERDFLFDLFLKDTGAPPAVTAFLRAQYPSAPKDDAQLRNSRSVLLTWNGDWG